MPQRKIPLTKDQLKHELIKNTARLSEIKYELKLEKDIDLKALLKERIKLWNRNQYLGRQVSKYVKELRKETKDYKKRFNQRNPNFEGKKSKQI